MFVIQALCALLVYDLLRFTCRFETICERIRSWRVAENTADENAVARVCAALNLGAVIYPKRALCLQRAFVLTYLLRKQGVCAHMVLGAQKLPFKAHAWVEVDGAAINERLNVQGIYSVWERC